MNNAFINSAMESLVGSTESVCNLFFDAADRIQDRIVNLVGFLAEGFIHSANQAKTGAVDLVEGIAGLIVAPIGLAVTFAALPSIALIWTLLFILSAIVHTAAVPVIYVWYLYQKFREAIAPLATVASLPKPESVTLTPPVLALSAIAFMAGMGIEVEPAPQVWTPSFIPSTQEEVQLEPQPQVETIDIEAFRKGLEQQIERQFNVQLQPRNWKDYILQNLVLPVAPLKELQLVDYPHCQINPDTQIEVVQEFAVRETVSPFPAPTISCDDEMERSLPLEVSIAPEFPKKPSNQVLQRWDKGQLVAFCDRVNAVKKGSITKYKRASKTLLIKKIKEFYV